MYTYVLISLGFSSQQPVLFFLAFFYQTLKNIGTIIYSRN